MTSLDAQAFQWLFFDVSKKGPEGPFLLLAIQ
jgi:hypothetical protein